jgi:LPXTG-motif cell wall-anchored protein
MNIPSLYSAQSFYDTTSALNAFCSPSTRGVSGTLRSNTLCANPAYGNIGYANRISGTGGFFDDFLGGAKQVGQSVLGFVAPSVGSAVESLIGIGVKKAKEALGYQFLEVVQVPYKGTMVAGTKVKKPDGTFVVMLADGTELPYTLELARQTQTVDPKTGLPTAAVAGIALGAVALIGLIFFMSKRR